MIEIPQTVPEQWRGFFEAILLPIQWLFPFQGLLFDFVMHSDNYAVTILKYIFLLLPVTSIVVGMWCCMLAVYTILFRPNRTHFLGSVLVGWWDVAQCTWLYWAGMGKFLLVAFGSFFGLLRLVVAVLLEIIREIVELPFVLTGTLTRNMRTPGVPWLAFLMTLIWCVLEAIIFTYILTPTFGEVISDLVGAESSRYMPLFLGPILFFMIAGSFACVHVLTEAVKQKDVKQIVYMAIVEVVVMFVEVVFLYRELIDAITPWIAQQTGVQMGLVPVLAFASMGWLGIRAMVWLLFGRFGTPTLLALIARQRLLDEPKTKTAAVEADRRWENVISKIKKEQDWFLNKAEELLEAAVLPVFQVVAAGLNFPFIHFASRMLFHLPFKTLADVKDSRELLQAVFSGKESK